MFESRIPLYLILCALALVGWTAAFPGAAPLPVVSWTIAGLIGLYILSAVIFRAGRSEQPVTSTLEEAARQNAARIAAPRSTPSGEAR